MHTHIAIHAGMHMAHISVHIFTHIYTPAHNYTHAHVHTHALTHVQAHSAPPHTHTNRSHNYGYYKFTSSIAISAKLLLTS